MDEPADWRPGGCHCGSVRFKVRLAGGLKAARRCTCSYCRMKGAVVLSAAKDDIRIEEGEGVLTEYRFNTKAAQHFFCSKCGIYICHHRRSNPDQIGINAACLDGVSPFDFQELTVYDGVAHPSDNGGQNRIAGVLRFEPSS